jgi:glycolate oxidase FAD binding subunit
MMQLGAEIVREALVPAAVVALDGAAGERYTCSVLFEGFARGVEQQMAAAAAIAARLGLRATPSPAEPPAQSFEDRERAVRRGASWRVRVSARPTELARFLAATVFPPATRRAIYPLLGAAFIAADSLDAATIAAWRASLDGGSVVVAAMPETAREAVDTWGAVPAAAHAIMRRLKAHFDPKGLCNAGRFVGGL